MKVTTDLSVLLEQLRLQGIPIGTLEYSRLHAIFAAQPQLSRHALNDLLCTVLAKDDYQRRKINQLFHKLLPLEIENDDEVLQAKTTADKRTSTNISKESKETEITEPETEKIRFNLLYIGAFFIALIVSVFIFLSHAQEQAAKPSHTVEASQSTTSTSSLVETSVAKKPDALKLVENIPVWQVESLTIITRNIWQELLIPLLLFISSSLAFLWLLNKALEKVRQRKATFIPLNKKSKSRYSAVAIKHLSPYQLLNTQDRFRMAWGVSHYLSDENTQNIDIEHSVKDSAQQGLPVVHFEQAKHEREVWLWQDRLNDNPLQQRLNQEIQQTLASLNVHLKLGYFNQLPYSVDDENGNRISSVHSALPQHQPLIIVCLDTNNVNASYATQNDETEQTFQYLKQWNHLAIVDCSQRISVLKTTVEVYQLSYLLPQHVAQWFAHQGQTQYEVKSCSISEVSRWASACALAQRIVTQEEAYALHHAMGLDCAWQYAQLITYGNKVGDAYDFRPQQQRLLNKLLPSDYKAATGFWLQRLDSINAAKKDNDTNWKQSRARLKNIVLPQQLLRLWLGDVKKDKENSLKKIVDKLSGLHKHKLLKNSIEQSLGQYRCQNFLEKEPSRSRSTSFSFPRPSVGTHTQTPQRSKGFKESNYIELPFNWQELDAKTQQQLLTLGFGGRIQKTTLQWDNATSLILGSLAGLSLLGLAWAIFTAMPKEASFKTRLDSAQPSTFISQIKNGKPYIGTSKGKLFLSKDLKKTNLEENQIAKVKWQRNIKPAQEKFNIDGKKAELWRLGTRRIALKRNNQIVSSLALINAPPTDPAARELAALLLDSGTADQVLISHHLAKYQYKFKNWSRLPSNKKQQLQRLYIHSNKYAVGDQAKRIQHLAYYTGSARQLLAQLKTQTAGQQDVEKLGFKVLTGRAYFANLSHQPLKGQIKLANNMLLMPIPTGQFEMGSNRYEREKPVHTVTISQPFWMSQTEVTFEQYDAYAEATAKKKPDDDKWGRATRPVINVSWEDAQGYVKWLSDNNSQGLQCRLPSEAEWEYAARAGSTTKYYWGDKPNRDYANYGKEECCGGVAEGNDKWVNTAPAGSFKANDWGLQDMSGNVYEWTQDCYEDNYEKATNNGLAWEGGKCADRVFRDGSWYGTSFNVRSAIRDYYSRDHRNNNLGFRLVCSLPLIAD